MKHSKGEKINGWLIIDKPVGIGSTTIVNQTRRLFNAQKNGHTGTLDPFASGVLPIAFGEATKLIPYVTDGTKEYEFTLKFGSTTDTLDLTGQITSSGGITPTKEQISAILPSFIGEISQSPPAYSAIKINGKRAYDLARQGQDVTIPERRITIYDLQLLEILPDSQARFLVSCSKGTYVRTLGADIAQKLNTCGHLTALRRTKCGNFSLSDTILLDNLKKLDYSALQQSLLPMLTCLCDITVIAISQEDAIRLQKGQKLSAACYSLEGKSQDMITIFADQPIAIVRVEGKSVSPIRVFNL